MKIALTPQAVSDLEEAFDYYRAIDQELSARFVEGVDAALERIVMFPQGSPPIEGFDELRRARIRQFPFGLFYQAQAGEVLVVRMLHS